MPVHGKWRKRNLVKSSIPGASAYKILTHSGFRKYGRFGLPSLHFEVIAAQSKVIGKKTVVLRMIRNFPLDINNII